MPEIPGARFEGGLWCHEVLEHLDAYVAGTLSDELRASAEDHLRVCDHCAQFGGAYAELVRTLHATLSSAPPLDADRAARLDEHLARITQDSEQ